MIARRAALVATLAAVVGCGGGHRDALRAADPPSPAASCPPAGRTELDGGVLQVPAGARAGGTPLIVVVVPGGDGDRSDRLGVTQAGTRAGFAVLYPTSDDTFWALNRRQGAGDVDALSDLLDRALASGCFDRAGSVPRYTARWARRDGCERSRATTPRRLVTRVTYSGCDNGLRVERLRLSGTDHGWPGAGPPLPDHNPSGVSATRELLRFIGAAAKPQE